MRDQGQQEIEKERLILGEDSDTPDRVAVDFLDIDTLIGSLCHVADLNSDREYRDHLKSELKARCRGWLEDLYTRAGYYQHKEKQRREGDKPSTR